MNPFLLEFKITKLVSYIHDLQKSLLDKKMSPKKRPKYRDDIVDAQKVLQSKVAALKMSRNVKAWQNEAGIPVRVLATKMVGIVQPGTVPNEPDMLLVTSSIPDSHGAELGTYYPEELEIFLPKSAYDLKLT